MQSACIREMQQASYRGPALVVPFGSAPSASMISTKSSAIGSRTCSRARPNTR